MKKVFFLFIVVVFFINFFVFAETEKTETGKTPPAHKKRLRDYFQRSSETNDGEKKMKREPVRVDSEELNPEGMVDLIDSPTSNIIDYGAYRLNFRLYSQGGLVSHLSFGVFRRLNIGASWDNEQVIGSETPRTNAPALNVKFRVYDGSEILPSVAIGYDGQGRFFNRALDEYDERERGLFVVFERELLIPKLEAYGSANIAKFKDGTVLGSVGLSYTIEQKVALMTEYDNIRSGPDNRWNAGIRIFPLPALSIDFAFRRIASNKDKERIIRINFVGNF